MTVKPQVLLNLTYSRFVIGLTGTKEEIEEFKKDFKEMYPEIKKVIFLDYEV